MRNNFATVLDAVAEARVQERQATAAEPTPSVSPLREQCGACAEAEHTGATTNPYTCGADNGVIVTYGAVQAETVIDDAALRELVFSLPNILGMSDQVERGSRQRDRYIVRVTLRDPNIPLERSLAARIPRNVHIHCQGRGAGGQRGVSGTAAIIYSPTGRREDAIVPAATPETPTSPEPRRFADFDAPQPTALPRFTADELDDVDHTAMTKLDQATLRRGRLPTVEQIAKYREVRAKRTGGTVADALKESRIDCEVAQYVLERWAGGLGDDEAHAVMRAAGCVVPLKGGEKSLRAFDPTQGDVDKRARFFLDSHGATLDTSEKPSLTVQRERQEAEERRQRLAQVQAQIAAERATAQPQDVSEPSRFDLIEPDPQADPAASIRAWEARQVAAKRARAAVATMPAKPAAVPRKPAIEVVDAESDGLSRGEVLAALLGRAMHEGC